MNRKEFFKQGARWIILSGFGAATAFLAANNRIVKAEECPESEHCRNCGKYGRCELPQAKRQQDGK